MLGQLGEVDASRRLLEAVEATCGEGLRTGQVGGTASLRAVGDAVASRLR